MASVQEMINLAKYQSGEGRLTGNGNPGGGIINALSAVIDQHNQKMQADQEKQQKKLNDQIDQYKTLREAGYDPKRAYDAVQKRQFPTDAGGVTGSEIKSQNESTKIKAETDKLGAETNKLTAEANRINSGTTSDNVYSNRKGLENKILQKVATGATLTPGEEKVYNDVIKKKGSDNGTLGNLVKKNLAIDESFGSSKKATAPVDEYVKMFDPGGAKKKVKKSDVKRAIAQGWKAR